MHFLLIVLLCFLYQLSNVSCEVDLAYWLRKSESKIFSQNGEDGLIGALIDVIEEVTSIDSIPKTFVEFGVEDGSECNTRLLSESRQFVGVLMDGSNENTQINLHKRFITAENVNALLGTLGVPFGSKLGILSIDLDRNDWHVWKSILETNQHRAVIVIIEYNSSISPDEALVVPYEPSTPWDGTHFYGASLKAMTLLAERHGYALVACDSSGTNAFFIDREWHHFQQMKRGGFGSLLLPSIHSAYVRANYIGEQPASTSQEHDKRLSLPVNVGGSIQHVHCPLDVEDFTTNSKSTWQTIHRCSQNFVESNRISAEGCIDAENGLSCAAHLLREGLLNRRWRVVGEDGEMLKQ